MAELESSLISERVTAGMKAAAVRGRHLGRPPIPARTISEIEALASSTELSIRQIQREIAGKASHGVVGVAFFSSVSHVTHLDQYLVVFDVKACKREMLTMAGMEELYYNNKTQKRSIINESPSFTNRPVSRARE